MGTYDRYDDYDTFENTEYYSEQTNRRVTVTQEATQMNAVVDEVKWGKVLVINGQDFSAFSADQCQGVSTGDTVTFKYKHNIGKNGKSYQNIQGKVKVLGKGSGGQSQGSTGSQAAVQTAPPVELPPHYMTSPRYLTLKKTFPVAIDHPDRSIIRQNAGNQATALLAPAIKASDTPDDILEKWKYLVDFIESYTSGDIDALAAEAAMKELNEVE